MRSALTITIVGPGNLGSALAISLREAGYHIDEIVSRSALISRRRARFLARKVGGCANLVPHAKFAADVVWLCVPDREIAACAKSLARARLDWKGCVVLHSSGALTSEELRELQDRGAAVASAHPLMTFVSGAVPSLRGVGFAVEGNRAAVRAVRVIIARLGGEVFAIPKKQKAAYHAWATLASPLVTVLLSIAEKAARTAGVPAKKARRRMAPILRATVENYIRNGAAKALSGPLMRGDATTIEKHLYELRGVPAIERVYRALSLAALESLPVANVKALKSKLREGREVRRS